MRRRLRFFVLAATVLLLDPLGIAAPAGADTFTVTTTADGGTGSLRWAFDEANDNPGPDTIQLGEDQEYDLTVCGDDDTNAAGDLDSTEGPVTILGNGSTIAQTCLGERVIQQVVDAELELQDVILGGGTPDTAGGGVFAAGAVTMLRSAIIANVSGFDGGGLWTEGGATLEQSLVAANLAAGDGGGIWSAQTVDITSSTVTSNNAERDGGGIEIVDAQKLFTSFATIVDNGAESGGNVNLRDGVLTSFGTVIGLPVSGGNCAGVNPDSVGHNYEQGSDTCGFDTATDVVGAGDPDLLPLGDYGGPTASRLPGGNSPLLNTIPVDDKACGGTDQRGISRPQGAGCDIGAVTVREPTASPGVYTTAEEVPVTMDVAAIVDDPDFVLSLGTLEVEWSTSIGDIEIIDNEGNVEYTPAPGFTAEAVVDYEACNTEATICAASTLTIDVIGVPEPVPTTTVPPRPTNPMPVPIEPTFTG